MTKKLRKLNSLAVTTLRPEGKKKGGHTAKTSATRQKFLQMFEATCGNISASCELAEISRLTYYRWMESTTPVNRLFQKKIKRLKPVERQLDLAEAVVLEHLKLKSIRAAELVLRSRGRDRGYADRQDFEYQLLLRAVERIETIISNQLLRDPDYKPDIRRFAELAAADFGLDSETIEQEFLKRVPQQLAGVQLNSDYAS